jgi:hypothetical protein
VSQELTRTMTEEALAASIKEEAGAQLSELIVPRLKVGQALTKEVDSGDAEVGDLINSLTGEVYGTTVQIIPVDFYKSRSWKKDTDSPKLFSQKGETVIPWEEHPEFGKAFVDADDAEEQYRIAVRANLKDWGRGPGISTVYNVLGLIVAEDGEVEVFPVRLPLERALAKAGRNLFSMLTIARAPWDAVYEVTTVKARSKRNEPYTDVRIAKVRPTTPEERQAAVEVAQAIHGGAAIFEDGPEEDEGGFAPTPVADTGGLEV